MLLLFSIALIAQEDNSRGYIVKVGDKAPDFSLETLDGKEFSLSEHKGKVVMLQFTASWCGVCRKEMPHIEEEIYKVFPKDKFVLLGIDREEPIEKVKPFVEQTGISYPMAMDIDGSVFGLFAQKGAGITRNIIINEVGEIIYLTRLFEREEFDAMKAIIQKALQN
jgi:peroxiredoxin